MTTKKLRALIVDDSKLVQEVLSSVLNSDDDIDVIGVADNGRDALEKIELLKPDFVTMDISMPVMGGLETIGYIMERFPLPVIVITDIDDANTAFHALSQGALEVISKSDIQPEKAEQLIRKVKVLARVKVIRHIRRSITVKREKPKINTVSLQHSFEKVVAIASSTGGPKALADILSTLPADFPYPILIAQHIEEAFVASLVEWMNHISALKVKMGKAGDNIVPGLVYISPAKTNLVVNSAGTLLFAENDPEDVYHPSCNKLLSSVGTEFGNKSIGVVLTGMGNDGTEGLKIIKSNGGATVAQDQASSVVFGMPRMAIESGCVDTVLALSDISAHLVRLAACPK